MSSLTSILSHFAVSLAPQSAAACFAATARGSVQ